MHVKFKKEMPSCLHTVENIHLESWVFYGDVYFFPLPCRNDKTNAVKSIGFCQEA